nr:hypothetical protein [Succinivibrio sp.]
MSERNSIGSNYSNSSNYSDSSFSSDGEDDLSTDQVQNRNNQQDVNETLHHSRKSNIARHIVLTVITGFTYLIGLGIYSIYKSVKARRVNHARLAENDGLQFNRTNQQIRQQNQVRRATLRQSQPNLQQWTYTLYQARSSINMHDPSSTNLKQSETGLFSKIANNYKNSSFNQVKNQDFAQIFKNSTLQTQVTNLMNDFIENQSKEKIDRLINNYFENDRLENLSDEQRRNLLMFCAQQELNNSHSRQLLNSATLTHGAFLKQFEALLNCVLVSHADNLDEAEQLDTKQSLINNALNWKVNPNQVKLSQANQNIISDLQDDNIIRSNSEDQIISTKQDSIFKANENLKPNQENGNKISSNLDEQINADEEAILQDIGEQQGTIYNTGNMTRREYQKIIADFKQPSSQNPGQETVSSQTTVQLKPQSAPAPKLNLETIRQQYLKGDVYLSKLNDADLPSMQAVLTKIDQKVLNNLSPNGQTYEDLFTVNKNLYYGLNHIFQAILASQVESFNPIKTVLQNNGIKPAANNSLAANQLMSLVINKLKDEGKLAALFDHQATGIELYKLVSTKALELVEPIIYDDNNDSETNNSIS